MYGLSKVQANQISQFQLHDFIHLHKILYKVYSVTAEDHRKALDQREVEEYNIDSSILTKIK
jgi:hypothetical protein